jgi:hypothetical protein
LITEISLSESETTVRIPTAGQYDREVVMVHRTQALAAAKGSFAAYGEACRVLLRVRGYLPVPNPRDYVGHTDSSAGGSESTMRPEVSQQDL